MEAGAPPSDKKDLASSEALGALSYFWGSLWLSLGLSGALSSSLGLCGSLAEGLLSYLLISYLLGEGMYTGELKIVPADNTRNTAGEA